MGAKMTEEGIEQVEAALVDATSKINVAEQELCKLWNPVLALVYKADSNFNDAHVGQPCRHRSRGILANACQPSLRRYACDGRCVCRS